MEARWASGSRAPSHHQGSMVTSQGTRDFPSNQANMVTTSQGNRDFPSHQANMATSQGTRAPSNQANMVTSQGTRDFQTQRLYIMSLWQSPGCYGICKLAFGNIDCDSYAMSRGWDQARAGDLGWDLCWYFQLSGGGGGYSLYKHKRRGWLEQRKLMGTISSCNF